MEEKRNSQNWWWGIASAAQLGLGIRYFRKGVGDSNFMPLKAFSVASLFVGAGATASLSTLRAFGIYKVEDLKAVGSSIRTAIRAPPSKRAEKVPGKANLETLMEIPLNMRSLTQE